MVRLVTISIKEDEEKAIETEMTRLKMKRHEVIKLAIRRYLFPEEERVPVNGKTVTYDSFKMPDMEKNRNWSYAE